MIGSILDEFEFILGEEADTEYTHDSNNLISQAKLFIENNSISSYQGINKENISKLISLSESDIIPWEHVKLTISVEKLRPITGERLKELIIPSFVEELEGTKNSIFGQNDTTINSLKYVRIPRNVLVIAPHTFSMYTKLEKVIFENNSKLLSLGEYTFACCDSIHTLDLSECRYLEEIKGNVFKNSNIKVLKLNSSLKHIDTLEDTNIEKVVIDDVTYTQSEFNQYKGDLIG